MKKKLNESVIGMELTEDFIYLALIEIPESTPVLKKVKSIAIPPRSIVEGQIADVDMISEQISKTLENEGFDSDNLIAGINDSRFLKRVEFFPKMATADLVVDLEMKVSKSYDFIQNDFQMGHLAYKNEEKSINEGGIPVLFAAAKSESIDSLEELASLINKTLVAVDLIPMASLRIMNRNIVTNEEARLYCYIDSTYVDFNFVYDDAIILSHSFKRNLKEIIEDNFLFESFFSTINQFILKFTDLYPNLTIASEVLFSSRLANQEVFFDQIKEKLNFSYREFKLSEVIKTDAEELSSEKLNTYSISYLPSIGLALKYFEKVDATLNITKVKKKLSPIFNKLFLVIFGGSLATILLIIFGVNFYLNVKINSLEDSLKNTKKQIKLIQDGEFVGRQRKLNDLKNSISYLGGMKEGNYKKYSLFKILVNNLPQAITFTGMQMSPLKNGIKININGTGKSQGAIYEYYSFLASNFKNVELSNIQTKYDFSGVSSQKFSISFFMELN